MKKGLLVLAAAVMFLTPVGASAAFRGGVWFGGPYAYGWYGPGPYWGPYWGGYYGYGYYNNMGAIKVDTKAKNAEIFINGAFASNTHDNKTLHLRPGTYNVEIREGGQMRLSQRVYVTAGKTLHLHPEL
jgi:hypothetical protein